MKILSTTIRWGREPRPQTPTPEYQSPELKWGDHHLKPEEVVPEVWAEPAAEGTAHAPTNIVEGAAPQHPGVLSLRSEWSHPRKSSLGLRFAKPEKIKVPSH
jgi:hypothetical protein